MTENWGAGVPLVRMKFFLFLFVVSAFFPFIGTAAPNVLLICVDDLKPTIASYGDAIAEHRPIGQTWGAF